MATTDQILAQMRQTQASAQLPQDVRNFGVTVEQSASSPLGVFVLFSPKGSYDPTFLANYAYININDPMTRVPGMGSVSMFRRGPIRHAHLGAARSARHAQHHRAGGHRAVQAQNNVNPAGQIGGEPVPQGQVFTFTVNTTGRLVTEQDFENIVIRANSDGSIVRVKGRRQG